MNFNEQVEGFFQRVSGVANVSRQATLAVNSALAPRFNATSLFSPNEDKLSRIVAFLLNPNGSHGQGFKFLDIFLSLLGLPLCEHDLDQVKVSNEDVLKSGNGRADIRIRYTTIRHSTMNLLLENKPWATDGSDQINRYDCHMQSEFSDEPWAIIYLSGDGSIPGKNSIARERLTALKQEGKFYLLPYNSCSSEETLHLWLNKCSQACEAERPRLFINDFQTFLENNVPNSQEPTMTAVEKSEFEIIANFLRFRDEDLKIALQIQSVIPEMKIKLRRDLFVDIESEVLGKLGSEWESAKPSEKDVAEEGRPLRGVMVRKKGWPQYSLPTGEVAKTSVGFEFQDKQMKDPKFGICWLEEATQKDIRRYVAVSIKNVLS